MTQYYYRNPLAAAWMGSEFGMRFRNEKGLEIRFCDTALPRKCPAEEANLMGLKGTFMDCWIPCYDTKAFYIHPASMQLLKPQVGDLVTAGHGSFWHWRGDEIGHEGNRIGIRQIHQRNGMPFHWPEFKR